MGTGCGDDAVCNDDDECDDKRMMMSALPCALH